MSNGEEQKVSAEEGSKVESEEKGTQAAAPEDQVKAQIAALDSKVDGLIHQTKILQGELHRERAERAKDQERFKTEREEERRHTDAFLGRALKGQMTEEEATAITEQYRGERSRLDLEAKLKQYEAKEEVDKALAEIRHQAELVAKDLGGAFGVDIPVDKLPDPTKFDSVAAYAVEVAKVARGLLAEKPPEEGKESEKSEEEKDKGTLATLELGPGAAPKEGPWMKESATQTTRKAAAELRKKYRG